MRQPPKGEKPHLRTELSLEDGFSGKRDYAPEVETHPAVLDARVCSGNAPGKDFPTLNPELLSWVGQPWVKQTSGLSRIPSACGTKLSCRCQAREPS